MDAANLIEMLDELEGEGRIRREIDPHDPRRRRIILTPAGSRKLRAGLRAAEQADDDVLGTLEPQQLGSLRETILHAYRSSQPKPWGPGEEQGWTKAPPDSTNFFAPPSDQSPASRSPRRAASAS